MIQTRAAAALRDFFFSVHAEEMAAALARLDELTGQAPAVADWDAVEFGFNRLFVGPMALEAPPYASVYLDPEPLLMGRSTLAVRDVYARLGLVSPAKNSLPDDHIALELDACAGMRSALEHTPDDELRELWRSFVQEHMQKWVPRFITRIEQSPETHPVFRYVGKRLREWLEAEAAAQPSLASWNAPNQEGDRYDD